MQTPTPKEILNYSEAAEYLGISERVLKHLVSQRKIRVARLSYKTVRIRKAELDRYAKSSETVAY
jgi:excisionase family DNA binding protein